MTSAGLNGLDATIRPVEDLAAAGLGRLTGYVQPLQDAVDRMRGNAAVVRTFTDAWTTAAESVLGTAERLTTAVGRETARWHGDSADGYRGRSASTAAALQDAATLAAGLGEVCLSAAEAVAGARRDAGGLLADLVRRLIDFARPAVAAEGVTTAVLATATSMVDACAGPIAEHEERAGTALARAESALLALVTQPRTRLATRPDHDPERETPPRTRIRPAPWERHPSYDEMAPDQRHRLQEAMRDRTAHVGRAEPLSTVNIEQSLRGGPPGTSPGVAPDPSEVAVTFADDRVRAARDVLSIDPTAATAAQDVDNALLRLSPFTRLGDSTTAELWIQVPNGTGTDDLGALHGRLTVPQEGIRAHFRDQTGRVLGTFGAP
ncbi:hypothetical protein [Umezawaea sp.]|uniref:WXG100 family type VII secretion target n=1 Tax=Umezawaea sp. TaxID=1955258 RepID=UPI002ED58B8A